MCEPVSISIGMMAVAGAITAYSQHEAGVAANNADKYQAKVAENNAIMANRNAQDALDRGNVEASQAAAKNRALMGSQRATFASNGLLLNSGSVGDVLGSQAEMGSLDQLTIHSNAAREAQGFKVEANNYTASGQLLKAQGAQAELAGNLAAAGTIAQTAGSVAGKWSTMAGPTTAKPSATTYAGAKYYSSNRSAMGATF
jgi:hypothetical protein